MHFWIDNWNRTSPIGRHFTCLSIRSPIYGQLNICRRHKPNQPTNRTHTHTHTHLHTHFIWNVNCHCSAIQFVHTRFDNLYHWSAMASSTANMLCIGGICAWATFDGKSWWLQPGSRLTQPTFTHLKCKFERKKMGKRDTDPMFWIHSTWPIVVTQPFLFICLFFYLNLPYMSLPNRFTSSLFYFFYCTKRWIFGSTVQ